MSFLYCKYEEPPEPPKELWLEIDYSKIDFKDMDHIKFIYKCIPETYTTLNMLYKVHNKNLKSYIDIKKDNNTPIYNSGIRK
mgnify:CR=1 FL=1|tara:strand:- start:84 stop:329 length:246 start_codon:yes stop_codon:yes gene_type:complete